MSKLLFPKNFLWGASLSAHQAEGNTHNQWTIWERFNAERLAKAAPKSLSYLPGWLDIQTEAQKAENYLSANGIEHYDRFIEDFSIMKKLNLNAFRFSIEWSRLEPDEGQWDSQAIEHYHQYIKGLKEFNIEPILTLWHWTTPIWFTKKGGFEKSQNIAYFNRFVAKIATEFSNDLNYVIILNEPNVYASFSYLLGAWPPQRKSPLKTLVVYRQLALAHKRAYTTLKAANPNLKIGIAAQLSNNQCLNRRNIFNRLTVGVIDYTWNWWFLNRIRRQLDFIGLNYYFTHYYRWNGSIKDPPRPLNDLGWYMEPSGIQNLLERTWHKYHLPILITENGLADSADKLRVWWLEQTIIAMANAINNGVDLFGYLHWSLLDNFEWAFGWWPKFGLVKVNRLTMQRTIKPSGLWFAKIIKLYR